MLRIGVVRLDGNGAAIGDDSVVGLAERRECIAEIVVCLREIRLDGYGAAIRGNGLVRLAERRERDAQIAMCLGITGLRCQRLPDQLAACKGSPCW